MICWVLWIIWSIINVYRYGRLNTKWCVLLILTGIIGYFIFSIVANPNNVNNNRKIKIMYISLFCFIVIALLLSYAFSEPYRIKRLYELMVQ